MFPVIMKAITAFSLSAAWFVRTVAVRVVFLHLAFHQLCLLYKVILKNNRETDINQAILRATGRKNAYFPIVLQKRNFPQPVKGFLHFYRILIINIETLY